MDAPEEAARGTIRLSEGLKAAIESAENGITAVRVSAASLRNRKSGTSLK